MRRRRDSEVTGCCNRQSYFSRLDSIPDVSPTLVEITNIYDKIKKGRDQEVYCISTKFGAPAPVNPELKFLSTEENETLVLIPTFPSDSPAPESIESSQQAETPLKRYLDFNMYRGLHVPKYLYFSQPTNTLLSESLEGLGPNVTALLKSTNYWLNITDPNESDFAMLFNCFHVHDFTISDIRERNTEEKIEFYQHYTFMSTRLLRVFKAKESKNYPTDGEGTDVENVGYHDQNPEAGHSSKYLKKPAIDPAVDMDFNILLFKNFAITMHDKKWSSINDILGFVNLVSSETPLTPDWVLYSIFIELAQDAQYLLSGIEPRINELRVGSTKNTREMSRVLHENYEMEFQLYAIQRFLKPKVNILRTLKLKSGRRFGRILLNLMNEIKDDFVEMSTDLRNLIHMLERSQDTFLALVSVEKSKEANEMSLIMERLSQIALIFLPIQAISGFFGMNVIVPWQNENSDMYFWLLVVISFVLGTTMYLCKNFILNKFSCGDEGRQGRGCCGGKRKSKQAKSQLRRDSNVSIGKNKMHSMYGPTLNIPTRRDYLYKKL